jgi:hypothetical protein
MTIQFTPQQQSALDAEKGSLPRIVDPRTNVAYVLIPESDFAAVQDILADDKRQQAIHAVALRNAVGRMNEAP